MTGQCLIYGLMRLNFLSIAMPMSVWCYAKFLGFPLMEDKYFL